MKLPRGLYAWIFCRKSKLARALRGLLNLIPDEKPAPYVIFPHPYRHNSAGIRALHRLIHHLNERGVEAYTIASGNPDWNEPAFAEYRRCREPILIYPEVVPGNPFRASKVVRWVLNTPGLLAGDVVFDPSELIFTWSQSYIDTDRILQVDVVEDGLFHPGNLRRDADRFYFGKGEVKGIEKLQVTEGLEEITSSYPPTRQELANLLQRTRVLYTYDNCTCLVCEALQSGCKVVILPEQQELEPNPAVLPPSDSYASMIDTFIHITRKHWQA